MSEETNVTQSDLDLVIAQVTELLEAFTEVVAERFTRLDDLQDKNEKMIAVLTSAYGEQTVVQDSLISALLKEWTEEQKNEFQENIVSARKELFDILGGNNAMVGGDPATSPTMADVAESDNSDTAVE